jgi:hypothetical protein
MLTGACRMSTELLLWVLSNIVVVVAICILYQRRLNFVKGCYRKLEEYTDTMLQHFQGVVLNVQGIINDLDGNERVRQRVEYALENAEKRLAQIREQMQPICSEQQQDRI